MADPAVCCPPRACSGKPLGFTLSVVEWEELTEEQNLGDEDVEFQDRSCRSSSAVCMLAMRGSAVVRGT